MTKPLLILATLILAVAGTWLCLSLTEPESPTETRPLPAPPAKALLPTIPNDHPALAQAADTLRVTVRDLHTSKTGSDLKHRKDAIREQVKTLQEGGADSIPVISALLNDPRPDVRVKAIGVLGGMDRGVYVPVLAKTVIAESHKPTRLQALMYLSQTRPRGEKERKVLVGQTREALLKGLADSDLEIRKAAARATLCIVGTLGGYEVESPSVDGIAKVMEGIAPAAQPVGERVARKTW